MKEKTIATYKTKNYRLQLVTKTEKFKETKLDQNLKPYKAETGLVRMKYEIRLNRKIIKRSIWEYEMRKLFAVYVQNHILQLKIE